jgi:hypothetical protein
MSPLKSALPVAYVLVDQCLEARIFTERVPGRIELKHRNGEAVWDAEQMIEQAKCFIRFTGLGINLCERSGTSRSIKSVLRFRQQCDCAFALGDRLLFST